MDRKAHFETFVKGNQKQFEGCLFSILSFKAQISLTST